MKSILHIIKDACDPSGSSALPHNLPVALASDISSVCFVLASARGIERRGAEPVEERNEEPA